MLQRFKLGERISCNSIRESLNDLVLYIHDAELRDSRAVLAEICCPARLLKVSGCAVERVTS